MEKFLYHHGIKGMRWGVRRTEAQLARARGKVSQLEEKYQRQTGVKPKTSSDTESKPAVKKPSEMTYQELQETVNRMNLEKRYKELNPEKVSLGKRFVTHVAKNVLAPAATEVGKTVVKDVLTYAVNKAKDDKKK